ncbi:SDR family NAD(P)-dependent oxidoreductase [Mesotoga sp. UBA5557]|uniref:SDR family NAD(P)-dependent oxidoreductase n=1 Tax=Mesotoga sp. UBA5557 TaxID=1946857 RepID=UPI0025E534B0|nr:SDR family NAD(P)-dependent oxidoreductase [Mesotoga sp. UBA5557]
MDYNLIREIMKKKYKRAMVTGGAGFIGSHIVDELLQIGLEVISVDNYVAGKEENLAHHKGNPSFEAVNCDITDYDMLKKHFTAVDVVFNEAASKKNVCIKDPRMDLKVNGVGTFNVLELARDFGVKKVVHASTGSVYGEAKVLPQAEDHPLEPVSYYGVSKLAGERYARVFSHLYGLDTTTLRYFHVYGPRQESGFYGGVVAIFCRNILEGSRPIIYGDGTQQRSFTYVKDVVRANMLVAANESTKGEVYNCASGINITVSELCRRLLKVFDKDKKLTPKHEDWLVGDIKTFSISNKKLLNLGFSFDTIFDKGLLDTAAYFKEMFGGLAE